VIGPGDTLIIYDAIHASGCSVSALRKLKHTVEKQGGNLKILRVGPCLFLDWDDCEKRINRTRVERNKAAKSRVDPAALIDHTRPGASAGLFHFGDPHGAYSLHKPC
jgi:hypothetical protein